MSKGAARLNDICTGHCDQIIVYDADGNPTPKLCCYPPRPNIQGSPDTYCNGRPLHCETHQWAMHCGPVVINPDGIPVQSCGCHNGQLEQGSKTVICNNLGVGRCGDKISCNSKVATCSDNVMIGD